MEREKMVEEIAHTIGMCSMCNTCSEALQDCDYIRHAQSLYKAGYRKVPEGAVVLTKEKYENLCAEKNDWKQRYDSMRNKYLDLTRSSVESLRLKEEQARKETARDMLKAIKNFLDEDDYNDHYYFEILAIAMEYGVEVEE